MRNAAIIARGIVVTAASFALGAGFYYLYVPLIPSFQLLLAPLFLLTLVLTAVRVEWGALWFVFAFPLVNGLPYFFGIYEQIPHAPLALVLFLAFFLGWLVRAAFSGARPRFPGPLSRPLTVLAGLIIISALVTIWRYANFLPFLAGRFRDLVVNVNGVRAGGAVMSGVFNALNYLSGIFLLGLLGSVIKTRAAARKWLVVLSFAAVLSLVFALGQKFVSIRLGNMPTWVGLGQINATFKDPNAFAAFLSAVLPVALAMALSFRRGLRVFAVVLAALVLFVFPSVGSRSAFLAICISVGTFCILVLAGRRTTRKGALRSAAVLLGFMVILFSLTFFQVGSRLFQRLTGDPTTDFGGNYVRGLLSGKLALWESAGRMVGDYPATGVGVGAYIIELPNYLQSLGKPAAATDSAENYFIQAGGELGLVGFGLVLGVFLIIIKHGYENVRRHRGVPPGEERPDLSIGVFCGLLALGVNFLFHSYIGSFEVIYTFWFLTALVFMDSAGGEKNGAPVTRKPTRTVLAAALIAAFGLVHLWNSTRSLSLTRQTERFGWSQDFGLYEPEEDPGRHSFRWTRTPAGVTVEAPGASLVIPMRAAHPDIEQRPVRVRVYLASAAFKKTTLLREVVFTTRDWVDLECPLPRPQPPKVYLVFESDRAWEPRRALGVPDPRRLALALGEVWSKYPAETDGPAAKLQQTVPAERWAGELGDSLLSNGLSRMTIKIDRPNPLLRLWLKGQRAGGVGPFVVIRLDGRVIGKTQVLAEDWTPVGLAPEAGAGEHVLSVEFTNDFFDAATGEDRNAYLGPVDVLDRDEDRR